MEKQQIKITADARGKNLLAWLRHKAIPIASDCGGFGTCNRCEVQVVSGQFTIQGRNAPIGSIIKACEAELSGDMGEIIVLHPADNKSDKAHIESKNVSLEKAAIALDIGTTTLEAAAIDTRTYQRVATAAMLNPQSAYGADVLSRISAADSGELTSLTNSIRIACKQLIDELLSKLAIKQEPSKIIVVGNPTMTHIFCGISPSPIGRYPFTPVFSGERREAGAILGYKNSEIILPALASAFIGSDITSGAAYLQLTTSNAPSLMVDLGTNGELLLWTGKELLSTTAAAGPALEGATISCGMGGVNGAIKAVQYSQGGEVTYQTIGDSKPIGICGSGLVDIIAYLIETKKIDETGLLQNGEEYKITDDIYLTQRDIREFQLAKGAIRAAIELILKEAKLKIEDLKHIYIAGGLGLSISVKSAITVGLIPRGTGSITTHKGNTALNGAEAALINPKALESIAVLAKQCKNIDLNTLPSFTTELMNQMYFR